MTRTAEIKPRKYRFDICFSRAVNIVTKKNKKLAVRLFFGWLIESIHAQCLWFVAAFFRSYDAMDCGRMNESANQIIYWRVSANNV